MYAPNVRRTISDRTRDGDGTDVGNADRFVQRFLGETMYCTKIGWMYWDGTRYAEDPGAVVELAKVLAMEMHVEASALADPKARIAALKASSRAQSKKAIENLIWLASSDPLVAVAYDSMNCDKNAINVANGELDLRNMELHPHNRASRNTKISKIEYDEDAKCPFWEEFINLIADGDDEMAQFVQRAVGYSLTGDISERKIFVAYGEASNGKTTFLETVSDLCGEYGVKMGIESFFERPAGGISNDIARLRGTRYAFASESDETTRLDSKRVKELTGGDQITARFLNHEFFTFSPTHKLWIATNHKPTVSTTDVAIWDRLVLVPFATRIEGTKRLSMTEVRRRFTAELPGILRWAVEGSALWYADGLPIPERVHMAITEYKTEMDHLGQFLGSACFHDNEARIFAAQLYEHYHAYCKKFKFIVIARNTFGREMKRRGYQITRGGENGASVYHGIGVSPLSTGETVTIN